MRGVMAFLVWLCSFWTWLKAVCEGRWCKTPPLDQASIDPSVGVEQLRSNEDQHESELATFLSSLSESESRLFYRHGIGHGFSLSAYVHGEWREFPGDESTRREFLAAVASSKISSCERISFGDRIVGYEIDLKELEEIVGALLSNDTFKTVMLSFNGCSILQMAVCVSNMLLGNKAIEDLQVALYSNKVVGKEAAELLANGLRANQVLKKLDLWFINGVVDDEAMEVLIKPLKENESALQHLRFQRTTDVGLEHIGVMLRTNTSLKQLEYWDIDKVNDPHMRDEVYMRGYTSLREALCINQTLEHLTCTIGSSEELEVLLESLKPMNNKLQANTSLTTLELSWGRIGGKKGVDILVDMIRTNTSLLELTLYKMEELNDGSLDRVDNVVAILEALKTNKSLTKISFRNCWSVGGYKVLGTMMDMLLENYHLEKIDLYDTPLENSGDAKYVQSELEKRRKMKVWDLIKGMANVSPKSGRVFLCGHPYAGKTTLRTSIKKLPEFQNKGSSRLSFSHHVKKIHDKFRTSKQPKVSQMKVEMERTRGIEVDRIERDGIGISIWDMAGQADYHSFHDLVIPNLSADGSCSLFLLTCNPMQGESSSKRTISDVRSEIEYWLRFIASNTRRYWLYRPHVAIVMTHFDYWNNEADFARCIEDMVEELKSQFEEVLEFDPHGKIFKVDGEDASHACFVFDFIKSHLRKLLGRLPKTIKACSEVQRLLAEWNVAISKQSHDVRTPKLPILKWGEFSNEICQEIEELQDADKGIAQRKQEFVAMSLNDGGHIMYHEEGKFVITDPHWFCHDIMGEFLHHCANVDPTFEMVSNHGMISIKHVRQILLKIVGGKGHEDLLDEILNMMKKLHICYEQDDMNIMIPSTLQKKRQSLNWPLMHDWAKFLCVGRRVSCKDKMRTMLSLGFFPRLQVSFFNKFQSNSIGNSYQLFEDVIMFMCDGIEVIIEFDHVNIDILLRSEQSQDKMLEFYENGIMRHITNLLVDPTLGCPGVILEEFILRPECVQKLVDSKIRNDQFVSMEELELEVVTRGFDATYNWKQCGNELRRGCDKVKDLLGDKAWKKLLEKRYEDLQRYEREIVRTSTLQDPLTNQDNVNRGGTFSLWQVPERLVRLVTKEVNVKLDNIDKKLDVVIKKQDDILQMQEDIMKMQCNLFHEVSSRVGDWMEFSIKMQQSQIPRLVYLSEAGKRKLMTRIVPGLMEFQLHLMCESRDGIHEVVDQQGCKVNFGTNCTRTFVTMLMWGLKLATILTKIGAHVGGGMGGMVPDFGEGLQLTGLILDMPGLLDQMSTSCLKSLPDDVRRSPVITNADNSKAQEWLIEFLEPKCKEKSSFYGMFKLNKVVYKVGSGKQSIGWLCNDCRKKSVQSGMLYDT